MNLLYLDEVDSTNTYVKKNIKELDDKTVVYTSHQTLGKGRLSRKWVDVGRDNVYMTFVLKPSCEFKKIYSNLTQYLSVSLCNVLEIYGVTGQIKWPNDVLVDGKKIAGILCETSMQGVNLSGLALGIGVNLNTNAEQLNKIDKPVTSLSLELNKKIDRDDFINKLVNEFFEHYDEFLNNGFSFIKDDYIKRASFIGKEVEINVLGHITNGIAAGITGDGAIILNINGEKSIFTVGDIL